MFTHEEIAALADIAGDRGDKTLMMALMAVAGTRAAHTEHRLRELLAEFAKEQKRDCERREAQFN